MVEVEELPERREDLSHSCAVYNNTIVVAGGVDDDERVLASCVQYSPESDRWSRLQVRGRIIGTVRHNQLSFSVHQYRIDLY